MRNPVDRVVRAVSRRNSFAPIWGQFGLAHLIALGGVALLALYQDMSSADFWLLVGIGQALVALDNLISIKLTYRMWRPVRAWEAGRRDTQSTVEAWMAAATLPFEYVRRARRYPFAFAYLPFVGFITWKLHLHWYSFFLIAAAGTAVLGTQLIVRYFTMEIVSRPVLERIATDLPSNFTPGTLGLPLRWRLLATLPVINVVTGMVVGGIASNRHHAGVSDLGIAWLVAVGVSFTLSLELVVLVLRSLGSALDDLQQATERVRQGDYTTRVPVVSTDEIGNLAQSFNLMMEGLEERERLQEAFGAYVDPSLTERVLQEGSDLGGEEREVSIMFLDIRDFTAFAERGSPHQVVARLNELWEQVVPIVQRHGGHANKFIGDGLLSVFGAPEHLDDHADRAVAAALEVAAEVAARYGDSFGVGIGVNSGRVIAGTVGGGGRVEYTVIGDPVNVASRVEAATRETGDPVLITDSTRQLLRDGRLELLECAPVALKGKREPVTLWAPRLSTSATPEALSVPGVQPLG
jgi:adenylate cyclase